MESRKSLVLYLAVRKDNIVFIMECKLLEDDGIVLVHDGARPFLDVELIQ